MKKKQDKKNTTNNLKKIFTSYEFLYTTLIVLAILVLFLAITVLGKKREKDSANIIIPIMEKSSHSSIGIDLESLKGKEYKIKITNYRDKEVNKEEMVYSLTIKNDTNSSIILTKEDKKENLMIDQRETTLEGLNLEGNKKDSTIYIIKLEEGSKPSKDDKISVEITS